MQNEPGARLDLASPQPSALTPDVKKPSGRSISRIVEWIFVGLLLAFVALVLLLLVVDPLTWPWFARRESIAALSRANKTSELQQAVEPLGIFIPIAQDSSWIAIDYQDTHSFRIASLAIARDSGGAWFQSRRHFCGAFSIHRSKQSFTQEYEKTRSLYAKRGKDIGPLPDDKSDIDTALDAIGSAASLEEARKLLLKLGFEPLK